VTELIHIEVYLDGSYPKPEQVGFIFKSRCICNFLERKLGSEKFKTKLSRINIKCTKRENESIVRPLIGVPFLEVIIPYDIPSILDMDLNSLQENYIKIINQGLKKSEEYMDVPFDFCINTLDEFRKIGYVNKWIHSKREWGDIQSVIEAEVTVDKFQIHQFIYRNKKIIERIKIAETKPREMLFFHLFGKLELDDQGNILYASNKKIITKFNIEERKWVH